MGRLTEKEPGLSIVLGRDDRPDLVVNTPLVLKGGKSELGAMYRDTRHIITRTAGDENGDTVSITTDYLNWGGSLKARSTREIVLKDGQRARVNLHGRGVIYVEKA